MRVEGPFFNLAQAAEYVGYSADAFGRYAREYEIPRWGPKKNRFAKSDLEAWMHDETAFLAAKQAPGRRRPRAVRF